MAKRDENDSGSDNRDRYSKRSRTAILKGDLNFKVLPSYFTRKHHEDMLNALEVIQSDAKLRKTIRWSKLLPVLRELRINDRTASDCLKCMMELLRLFERYRCKDTTVILEVFQVLQILTGDLEGFLIESTKSENLFCIPYGEETLDADFVNDSASFANLGLLKLQLNFGMMLTTSSSLTCCRFINRLIRHWPYNDVGDTTEAENKIDYDGSKVEDEDGRNKVGLVVTQKRLDLNFNSISIKRLSLVLKVLNIVLQMKLFHKDCKGYFTECYRLIFNSLPVPYLTSGEVKATLRKCLHSSYARVIGTITENFKNLLPELAEAPRPRSLQHLCRIQVRQCLRQNLNLHSGVSSLPLPDILKAYVTLDDDGDYSVIAKTTMALDRRENPYLIKPKLYINIPERNDCVTSFITNMLDDG